MMDQRRIVAQLEALVSLALDYHGWTADQLAAHIDRSPRHLLPLGEDMPRFDHVARLARSVDVSLDEFTERICHPAERTSLASDSKSATFASLDDCVVEVLRQRRLSTVATMLPLLHARATSDSDRALAFSRETNFNALSGHFSRAVHSARSGLAVDGAPADTRLDLRINLSLAHLALDGLDDAETLARATRAECRTDRSRAYLSYALGEAARRRGVQLDVARDHLHRAGRLLQRTVRNDMTRGDHDLARATDAARLDCETQLGEVEPDLAISALERPLPGEARGSIGEGWSLVTAATIALRESPGTCPLPLLDRIRPRLVTIARQHADWELHAHAFGFDQAARQRRGIDRYALSPRHLDELLGVIGRFPNHLDLGLEMIEAAMEDRLTIRADADPLKADPAMNRNRRKKP